jgi:hypothetical protein
LRTHPLGLGFAGSADGGESPLSIATAKALWLLGRLALAASRRFLRHRTWGVGLRCRQPFADKHIPSKQNLTSAKNVSFLVTPPEILFSEYAVGGIYEAELQVCCVR